MQNDDIIRMANQIASFFKSYGNEEGRKEVAAHINNFWEPRMREQFFDQLAVGKTSFDPLVIAAAALIRQPANHSAHEASLPKHGEES